MKLVKLCSFFLLFVFFDEQLAFSIDDFHAVLGLCLACNFIFSFLHDHHVGLFRRATLSLPWGLFFFLWIYHKLLTWLSLLLDRPFSRHENMSQIIVQQMDFGMNLFFLPFMSDFTNQLPRLHPEIYFERTRFRLCLAGPSTRLGQIDTASTWTRPCWNGLGRLWWPFFGPVVWTILWRSLFSRPNAFDCLACGSSACAWSAGFFLLLWSNFRTNQNRFSCIWVDGAIWTPCSRSRNCIWSPFYFLRLVSFSKALSTSLFVVVEVVSRSRQTLAGVSFSHIGQNPRLEIRRWLGGITRILLVYLVNKNKTQGVDELIWKSVFWIKLNVYFFY